jgi:hypothetical protein
LTAATTNTKENAMSLKKVAVLKPKAPKAPKHHKKPAKKLPPRRRPIGR